MPPDAKPEPADKPESTPQAKRRWYQLSLRSMFVWVAVVGVLLFSTIIFKHVRYPFGPSHRCDTCLMMALHQYANEHGGQFPTGGATPEASLSLLYPKYADAALLGGKSVPAEVPTAILERGDPLGPESCGWHYVDGLSLRDDPELAILWDKNRLGHNGQREADGRTKVIRVGMAFTKTITAKEWPELLEDQRKRHAARQLRLKKPEL